MNTELMRGWRGYVAEQHPWRVEMSSFYGSRRCVVGMLREYVDIIEYGRLRHSCVDIPSLANWLRVPAHHLQIAALPGNFTNERLTTSYIDMHYSQKSRQKLVLAMLDGWIETGAPDWMAALERSGVKPGIDITENVEFDLG